jgi:CheY-like chemotaxis protein
MRRVLVVEDNRLERKLLIHILRSHFGEMLRIDEVIDGSHAIQYLQYQQYDLIITDLIMPRIEGLELIRHILKNYSDSRVMAISGSNPYYLYLAKKIGVDEVLTKPLDHEKLLITVDKLLNLSTAGTAIRS